jgi:hypothetical protein
MAAILGGVLGIGVCIHFLWLVFNGVKGGSIRIYSGDSDCYTYRRTSEPLLFWLTITGHVTLAAVSLGIIFSLLSEVCELWLFVFLISTRAPEKASL